MSFFRGISVPAGRCFAHRAATLFLSTLPGLLLSQSAFAANITVASPVSGARVASTLWVRAHNVGCSGMGPVAFGYSIDNSTAITWGVTAYDIDVTKVAAKPGAHVVHFKSWTARGLCPVVNTAFTASTPTSVGSSTGGGSGSTTGSGSGTTTGGGSSTGSGSGTTTGGGGPSTGGSSGSLPAAAARLLVAAPDQRPAAAVHPPVIRVLVRTARLRLAPGIFRRTPSAPAIWTERSGRLRKIRRWAEGLADRLYFLQPLRSMTRHASST